MRDGIVRAGDGVRTFGNYLVVKNDQRSEGAPHPEFDVLCGQFYCSEYVGVCNGKDLGFQNIPRSIKNRTVPSPDVEVRPEGLDLVKNSLFEQAHRYVDAMQIAEACESFQLAEEAGFDPDDCAAGRWTCHMLLGHFESAWAESDAISRRGKPDPHRFWDGRPFDGRHVLIRCLHGLGDTLQYVRYFPLIRERAASLTVEAQPLLRTLLAQAHIADRVISWGDEEPFWNQQVEIVELPLIFRTSLVSIPATVPYLNVPNGSMDSSFGGKHPLRVGFVWASSAFNPARSLPLAELATLFDIPDVSFFSFQAGDHRAELQHWSNQVGNLYTEGQSVLDTAMSMKTMDLVITVDTMTAHLAGAMGLEVWTLLPYACDWRWMLRRTDSPWYPTMRLFRQPAPGAWEAVVHHVRSELAAKVQMRSHV